MVYISDLRGRNPKGHEPLTEGHEPLIDVSGVFEAFTQKMREANIEHGPEKPVLLGRHLLDVVEPGPKLGKLLDKAYDIQIEEGITDPEELKKRVLK